MRYFIHLRYLGSDFSGWQIQPNADTVQETIQNALRHLDPNASELTGCGRTDTGVHADQFYAHFDAEISDPVQLAFKLDQMVGRDIHIQQIFPVPAEAHARYSAELRQYRYYISGFKPVFGQQVCWHYPLFHKVDWDVANEVAALLMGYAEFKPFCKSDSSVTGYACRDMQCNWEVDTEARTAVFTISANRFLRGMVRLIVGACLYAGTGKMTLEEIRQAMEEQNALPKAYAVPPTGLFLSWIRYPFFTNGPVMRSPNSF